MTFLPRRSPRARHRSVLAAPIAAAVALLAGGCAASTSSSPPPTSSGASNAPIVAVGAENEYADVISQIGGKYVKTTAILSNPNTDPHTFEASPSIAQTVGAAKLVVENGAGYDDYMNKIEEASPSASRRVLDVQQLLGLPDSTPNPHLWYKPATMPALAKALVAELSRLKPAHAVYFQANAAKFERSLRPWVTALREFSSRHPGTAVATTEPVGDYMLEAAGIENLTPFSFQADLMNGTDPPPQDVSLEEGMFSGHRAKILVYNRQVTDPLTETFLESAARAGVPVVGVYETMPTPGYHYQSWMLAEVRALERALTQKASTEKL